VAVVGLREGGKMGCSLRLTQPGVSLLAAVALALAPLPRAAAADAEVRLFNNFIDGKYAGDYRMTITTQDDGTVTMDGQGKADIRILPLVRYTYSYRGREVWKDGRLLRFDSSCNDNGKAFTVTAVAEPDGLHVTVNNRPRVSPLNTWVTTYWRLPEAAARGTELPLLDADSGKDLRGALQYVGESQVPVAGQLQNCTHYRVTGKEVQVDLWYDAQERLVRQEWVEQKSRIVLQLSQVQR
jgi:hypothetical protein